MSREGASAFLQSHCVTRPSVEMVTSTSVPMSLLYTHRTCHTASVCAPACSLSDVRPAEPSEAPSSTLRTSYTHTVPSPRPAASSVGCWHAKSSAVTPTVSGVFSTACGCSGLEMLHSAMKPPLLAAPAAVLPTMACLPATAAAAALAGSPAPPLS